MGRKKKQRDDHEDAAYDWGSLLARESIRAVWGIFCLAVTVFLLLAAFGYGGLIGNVLHAWLSTLVGIGYALLPLSFAIGSVIFFRAVSGRSVSGWQIGSTIVFLFSALGLLNVMLPTKAGIIGEWITKPLLLGLDTPATVTFLLAFTLAALVIAFDVHPVALFRAIREWLNTSALETVRETFPNTTPLEVRGIETDDVEDETPETPTPTPEEIPEEEIEPEIEEVPLRINDGNKEYRRGAAAPIRSIGGTYTPPPTALLAKNKGKPEVGDIKANANIIKRTLQNFGIEVEMDEVAIGPTVTRYAMKPAEGVRLSKILALQSNLELALAASPVRIEAPIPGKSLVGIEVPNFSRTTLGLAPLMSDTSFTESDKPLYFALGRTISGAPHFADLARAPHLLIAGATGSGKSVMIHDLIISLLYRQGPDRMRFVMIDPKRVELTLYNSIPHLLTPVITDPKRAILALKWLAKEMDRRYDVLESERVRDINSYHENVLAPALNDPPEDAEAMPEPMPYIVVIIDELADIMQTYPRELEAGVVRLAQMSRAVGIHLVLSTQRPSVKVITGLIKANIPARIALQVASQIDSRTILDMGGAEKLLGAGDMLFLSGEMSKPRRIQSPFVTEQEVKQVAKHLATAYAGTLTSEIDFSEGQGSDALFSGSLSDDAEGIDDDLYEEAKAAVMQVGKASTSYLQRKLRIGYARAARLMDILEEQSVIGPADGSRPREVLLKGAGATTAAHSEDADSEDADAENADRV
ncbi:MAG: DNA translocase FtsK [Parcubacteria group bacterium]|nr:DNA translocase FtsK [Parcubacteria group bacterium]